MRHRFRSGRLRSAICQPRRLRKWNKKKQKQLAPVIGFINDRVPCLCDVVAGIALWGPKKKLSNLLCQLRKYTCPSRRQRCPRTCPISKKKITEKWKGESNSIITSTRDHHGGPDGLVMEPNKRDPSRKDPSIIDRLRLDSSFCLFFFCVQRKPFHSIPIFDHLFRDVFIAMVEWNTGIESIAS